MSRPPLAVSFENDEPTVSIVPAQHVRRRDWGKRVARSIGGASAVGSVAAMVDALWAWSNVEGERAPGFMTVARFDVGLLAPIALLLGIVVAVGALVLEPDRPRSPRELWQSLWHTDPARRTKLAAFLAFFPPFVVLWATAVAHWAQSAMSAPGSNLGAGFTVATLAFGLSVMTVTFALAAGELIARRLSSDPSAALDPRHALLGGLVIALALVLLGTRLGNTSGEGAWLGIWGVLRRPELDLRPVLMMAVMVMGGYFAPHFSRVAPAWALVIAWAPFAFTYEAAVGLGGHPDVAGAIERGAPFGSASLSVLRHATDRDHDGYSAFFGAGDCDDSDARINPAASDVPGNGVDEDCSGADATISAPVRQAPPPKVSGRDLLPKGLNVILITVDTLRADLGYAGNPRPVSPILDALAGRSIVFERAYSLASYTGKSVGPLLIGKYPSETQRGWGHFNRYTGKDTLVAERLQKAGVHTVAVHAHWYFTAGFGLNRGFDTVNGSAQPHSGDQDNDATVTGGGLTDAAIRVFSDPEHTSKRFFGWIHYLDPHSEYAKHHGAPSFGTGMRAAYDGEVWYTDQQIGRFLSFAAQQPWAERTAIVFTSDHGEAFGEHGMIRHGVEIFEELVRVPFFVYVPGIAAHHVTTRRSAIDLVPTLLDLFGVVLGPPQNPFDFLSGQSLADDIAMPPGHHPAERDVFVDMPAGPNNGERRALIRDGHKLYVSNAVRYQIFDLEHDPGEKTDISDDKALLLQMKGQYQTFKSRLHEVVVKPVPKE
ncbi:MAG TPA: sulfatase-like hydrolase/transferase [Polyangiaceae bacterium]|nr:sulfatase-like hydrolase/transferase [Polyangiaceae bacterium]